MARRSSPARIPALLVLALMPALPPAVADHYHDMTVTQSGIGPQHQVTLHVTYRLSGECCGGIFVWTTGDGRQGQLHDGVTDGVYDGDARGYESFADTRPYGWQRVREGDVVHLSIWYWYRFTGLYDVTWRDCCPEASGALTVVAV